MHISLSILVDCGICAVVEFFLIFVSTRWRIPCNIFCNFIFNQITCCFCCFLNCSLWCSLKAVGCRLYCCVKKLLSIFTAQIFVLNFAQAFAHVFCKGQESIVFDIDSICRINWKCYYITLSLITKVKFILYSISRGLEFWSVDHKSMYGNSGTRCFCVNLILWWNI